MIQKHLKRMVAAVIVALTCSVALAAFLGRPSGPVAVGKPLGTKMVYIDAQYRVDAVTITKVTVGDQQIQPGLSTGAREVQPGAPFQADEDWLKTMSISIKNRTNKVIVRAEIQLWFPDTGNGGPSQPVTTYTMTLGQLPDIDSYTSRGERVRTEPGKQPLWLAPGQTLVIHVADYLDGIQSRVEVTRVAIQRLRFYFVDGMRWDDLNGFGVPDPNHPGQFANKDRSRYFPGDRSQDWPPPTQPVEPGQHRAE